MLQESPTVVIPVEIQASPSPIWGSANLSYL